MWSRGRLQKFKQLPDSDCLRPEIWSRMSKAAHKKEKASMGHRITKARYAWKLRGNYFIDPEDGEFKETIKKHARQKLEVPMEAALPGKLRTQKRSNMLRRNRRRNQTVPTKSKKTKHACIVEADEFKGKRLGSILPEDHENHIAEKGFNSMSH